MFFLFNTKLRKNLLAYSFTHSDGEYYVRELAAIINEDAGNLSRELRNLEKEGLYKSYSRGRLKIYSLNKKFPLFQELKKIVFKTQGVEGSLKDLVAGYAGISTAFIHGSYARGKEKEKSDIDIVLAGSFPQEKFFAEVCELEARLGREINITPYLDREFTCEKKKPGSFLNMIIKDKIIILKGSPNE
ncbi:MAG: nucleotidyltransferase domain-containing protein [Planctomycetes bacterium]|nr:nucleotidyltransferase domain-containing protein [Planctomycetota bacterium]